MVKKVKRRKARGSEGKRVYECLKPVTEPKLQNGTQIMGLGLILVWYFSKLVQSLKMFAAWLLDELRVIEHPYSQAEMQDHFILSGCLEVYPKEFYITFYITHSFMPEPFEL